MIFYFTCTQNSVVSNESDVNIPSEVEKAPDNQLITDDPIDEIIKSGEECKKDIEDVKNLIQIPTVAISSEDFVYCDLPTSIQGYKDVSINWETTSPQKTAPLYQVTIC